MRSIQLWPVAGKSTRNGSAPSAPASGGRYRSSVRSIQRRWRSTNCSTVRGRVPRGTTISTSPPGNTRTASRLARLLARTRQGSPSDAGWSSSPSWADASPRFTVPPPVRRLRRIARCASSSVATCEPPIEVRAQSPRPRAPATSSRCGSWPAQMTIESTARSRAEPPCEIVSPRSSMRSYATPASMRTPRRLSASR